MALYWGTIYTSAGKFEQYYARLYHNGQWVKCKPMVYYDGAWHTAGTLNDIMENNFSKAGTGDTALSPAKYPAVTATLFKDANGREFLTHDK